MSAYSYEPTLSYCAASSVWQNRRQLISLGNASVSGGYGCISMGPPTRGVRGVPRDPANAGARCRRYKGASAWSADSAVPSQAGGKWGYDAGEKTADARGE